MKDFYTRKEIMQQLKISRRVIEGYEEVGLIKPSKHDEKGGLLYSQETFKIIGFIRLCQKMGYELKEILELISSSNEVVKQSLAKQTELMAEQLKKQKYLLKFAVNLANSQEDPRKNERIITELKEEKI